MEKKPVSLNALVEDLVRAAMANTAEAVKLSGKAINPNVPCYLGSEAHIQSLVRAMLREVNNHGLFINVEFTQD